MGVEDRGCHNRPHITEPVVSVFSFFSNSRMIGSEMAGYRLQKPGITPKIGLGA